MPLRRPKRLDTFDYIGRYAYSLTICTYQRHRAFADREFACDAVDRLLRTAKKFGFELFAYCLMPDHVHLILLGERGDSDLEAFVRSWNTQLGFQWRRRTGGRLWQGGYFERVIRSDVNLYLAARYVVMNPVRAGLVESPGQYEFTGSTRYTIPELLDDGFSAVNSLPPELQDEDDEPKGSSLQERKGRVG